jgi:TfoX/Sxy family transcriptional regulator of competence genes
LTPEARYSQLVKAFSAQKGVSALSDGKGFGSTGQLKFEGRIFAMLVRGELVVKLPRSRVDELVAQGDGAHFDAGKGKPMKEWFVLSSTSRRPWASLAEEALDFSKAKR